TTRPGNTGSNTSGTTTRPATGNNSGNNNSGNTGKIIYSNTANNGNNSGNNNASSGNNGKVTFNNLGKTPSTGDHKNIVIWGIVLTISVILLVAVVYAYMNNKKKAAKRRKNRQRNNDMFYSLFLVLTISLGLVFGNSRVVNAAPRQTEDRTITVVSTVSVDGDKVVVEGCVYYEKEVQPETPEPDHGNINVDVDGSFTIEYFYADTNDILVGDSAQVTFFAKINSQFMITDPVTVMDDQGNAAAYLNDEGTDGDEVAGDGIFTGTGTIGSDQRGFAYFHAECLDAVSETCSIYFYTEITSADYDRTTEIIEALNACETIDDALKYLDEQTDIEGYEEAEDHSAILLRTQWGITIDWTPHQETEATDAASMVKAPTTDEHGSIIASSGGNSYNSLANQLGNLDLEAANDKTDVCVVRPFRHNGFEYDDFLDCGNLIANEFGSSVVNFDDNAATMDAFKSFGQYGSVLIDSHGNLSNVTNSAWTIMDKDPYILTGETMGSWESFVSADWESERIIVIANDGSLFGGFMGGGIVAVGAGFFDKYYNPGDLDECMFFLGTCYSLYNNTIADALISKGAEVVYGFTDVVSVDYCNDCLVECVGNNLLVYHTTADEAYNTTVAVCGATDSRNANTRFEHAGAGGYKLVSSNGQIAGSVAAYDTGSPLVNATVTYTNQETGAVKTSYSNTDGSFGRKLEEGNYTVEVSAYGYLTEVIEDIEINVGQTTYLEASVMLHPVTDSIITGMITDATNACPIENAEIRFRLNHNNKSGNTLAYEDGAEVVVTTNAEGYYEFDKLPAGYYTMEVQADNYVTTYRNIIATGDGISQDVALSPILGDSELRIVLTWGENPRDLDSHLVGPKANGDGNFHIYYSNKTYSAGDTLYADLDLDDVDSYGPETTTLHETSNGMYYFYVHHFAGSQHISTSGAQVKVYKDDQLVATYNAPTDQGNDIYWNVFTYDPSTGTITTVNTITNRPVTD
ncbi:MAG: carboxypeptidase regulatory-like domain-containing protein, partial [Lachnospiraceae bacterium]|nr:carboxypeptidase regulatory-like domain-containing protein [Lachnospiraceae bacterium]